MVGTSIRDSIFNYSATLAFSPTNARAWMLYNFAYSPSNARSSSCVPVSATDPSFIQLQRMISAHKATHGAGRTHIIWSAYLVRCPNRCVTKTIVLPSCAFLRLSNNWASPSGSSAELGSSTATNLTLPEKNLMKVRELVQYVSEAGKRIK